VLTAVLSVALLLPPLLLLDRPPGTPRLTFIGGDDGLSVLIEGAGGGRLLIGGGTSKADLPAALGRQLHPWDSGVDLLLVTDRRDLPGATELVRRGQARAVVTAGLEDDRAAAAALASLRDTCAALGVSLRALADAERITIGHDGGVTLDVTPPLTTDESTIVRLVAGPLSAVIVTGADPGADPALGAILLRASQESYRAALAAEPRLVIAPAPPNLPGAIFPEGGQLLLIAHSDRTTLTIEGQLLRLSGAGLVPLDATTSPK
jgi:hypothetical protein